MMRQRRVLPRLPHSPSPTSAFRSIRMPISSTPVILATRLKPDQGCRLRISKQILRHTRCPTRGVGLWFTAERRKRWGGARPA